MKPASEAVKASRRIGAGRALILLGVGLLVYIAFFVALLFVGGSPAGSIDDPIMFMFVFCVLLGGISLVVGAFLKAGYGWARYAAVLVAVLAIFTANLLGLIVGVYVLWAVATSWENGSNNSLKVDAEDGPAANPSENRRAP